MTIEALLKVVPPPVEPVEAFVAPWPFVEAKMGTPVPHDYKEFVRRYGNGLFMEFIWISIPLTHGLGNPIETAGPIANRFFKKNYPEFPYAIWPEPGGLLPVGITTAHDGIFWEMIGSPRDWNIVVWGRKSETCEVFQCGLTDFLAGLATGTVRPKDFPANLTDCDHLFQPADPF